MSGFEGSIVDAYHRIKKGEKVIPYGEKVLDVGRPWKRAKYQDLIMEHAGIHWRDTTLVRAKYKKLLSGYSGGKWKDDEGLRELMAAESNKDLSVVVNEIFEAVVEPELAKMNQPVFVMDYPAELCPLTRRKADDPSVALRFECFVAGMELANAYTELNDPAVQEENFRQQLRGEAANETMRVMDEDFVTALRHGMPPAGGLGIGIDRVIMLLTNRQSIRDVVLFPLLRPTE
jgi:lysyl-tRNA synthetase class 2